MEAEDIFLQNQRAPKNDVDENVIRDSPCQEAEVDAALGHRDPVSVLMEWAQLQDLSVTYSDPHRTGPDHRARYHTRASLGGQGRQWGSASSKSEAKKMAARNTLKQLYLTASSRLLQADSLLAGGGDGGEGALQALAQRAMNLAEATQLVHLSRDKIFAALIMENRGQHVVVSLGTGNRVIHANHVTPRQSRLVDCHAEVVARRGFLRFLYGQLESHGQGKTSILTSSAHGKGRLAVRSDVTFHLYISRPPCGDAAAFPTIGSKPGRRRARLRQGQLRTKLADGEGSIPTETEGEGRLRVMTCSDKILLWNAVGIQGALLSAILDPVYLASVVIGSYVGRQIEHVQRALTGRLSGLKLTPPFRPCRPVVSVLSTSDLSPHSRLAKIREFATGWTLGDSAVEVIHGPQGAAVTCPSPPGTSRLASLTLLQRFLRLTSGQCHVASLQDLQEASRGSGGEGPLTAEALCADYHRVKEALCPSYQAAKAAFKAHLKTRGYGSWHSTLRCVEATQVPLNPP